MPEKRSLLVEAFRSYAGDRADTDPILLEQLAALEHEQWVSWAKTVVGDVSPERRKQWEKLFVPYDELPEREKAKDRARAKRVLDLVGAASVSSDEAQGLLLAGMIIGRENPDIVPNVDSELAPIEEELENDLSTKSYAGWEGLQLRPSKSNPRVRRWQRIKDIASGHYQGAKRHLQHAARWGTETASEGATEVSAGGVAGLLAGAVLPGRAGSVVGGGAAALSAKGMSKVALGSASAIGAAALFTALEMGDRAHKAVVTRIVRNPKVASGDYWEKNYPDTVAELARKTRVGDRAAASAMAKLYAYHLVHQMGKEGSK